MFDVMEQTFAADVTMIDTILSIEIDDRGNTPEQAKAVLVNVFHLTPEDAQLALTRFLYSNNT